MFGTEDDCSRMDNLRRHVSAPRALANRCELLLHDGQSHGFFNYADGQNPYYTQTLNAADAFLVSLGLLPPAP